MIIEFDVNFNYCLNNDLPKKEPSEVVGFGPKDFTNYMYQLYLNQIKGMIYYFIGQRFYDRLSQKFSINLNFKKSDDEEEIDGIRGMIIDILKEEGYTIMSSGNEKYPYTISWKAAISQ